MRGRVRSANSSDYHLGKGRYAAYATLFVVIRSLHISFAGRCHLLAFCFLPFKLWRSKPPDLCDTIWLTRTLQTIIEIYIEAALKWI